ncbi:MAG: hypothetical protein SGBAC_008547 [Bacillariaceae sp.]
MFHSCILIAALQFSPQPGNATITIQPRICKANPWLVDTGVNNKKRNERLMCALSNETPCKAIDAIFLTEATSKMKNITRTSSYNEKATDVGESGATCKPELEVIRKADRATAVTLLPVGGGQEFTSWMGIGTTS